MDGLELDWSSAEVREGRLEVGLRGERPRGWKDDFKRTLALLGNREWGKVKLKKDRVRVEQVAEGDEDRLRHFLESIVLQANAAHEQPESEAPADQAEDEDEDEADGPDAEMTKRFRSFGGSPDDRSSTQD